MTNSFSEYLSIGSISTFIFQEKSPRHLVDVSETTDILPTVAEVWMVPIIETVKNQHLYSEVLEQSKIHFRPYIRDIFGKFVDQVKNIISISSVIYDYTYDESYLDMVRFSNVSTHFFDRLPLEHYESVVERKDHCTGCNLYEFTHFFFMNFKIQATSMSFPVVRFANWHSIAEEEGIEMKFASNDGIPVSGLNLKFEINSDKYGVPLSTLKKFRVDINLVDHAHPQKRIFLKVQRKLNKLFAKEFRDRLNNVFF